MLCSGLVDDGRCSQDYCRRYMEPHLIIVSSSYPTSWAYFRNTHSHVPNHTTNITESVGFTKELTRGLPNESDEKKLPNLHRM